MVALAFALIYVAVLSLVSFLVIGIQPEIFAPYFLQVLHAQTPLIAGYLSALLAVGWTFASMLGSSLSG